MSGVGIILKAGHCLHRHRIGLIPVGYSPLILAAVALIAAITHLLAWQWAIGSAIVALALAAVVWLTGRRGYIVFRAKRFAPLPVEPLQVDEQVAGRATGYFEVSGKRRYFVEAQTYFSTVETREHILMACIPHARFLLIATSPPDEAGWWYAFFRPRMLLAVKTGEIHFGMRPQPALRMTYMPEDSSAQTVYLSFDDVNSLHRVLNDLRLDLDLP
jgi:hypothetical protein